jgi:hypothetical protein
VARVWTEGDRHAEVTRNWTKNLFYLILAREGSVLAYISTTCSSPQTVSRRVANNIDVEPTIGVNIGGLEPTITANEPTFPLFVIFGERERSREYGILGQHDRIPGTARLTPALSAVHSGSRRIPLSLLAPLGAPRSPRAPPPARCCPPTASRYGATGGSTTPRGLDRVANLPE